MSNNPTASPWEVPYIPPGGIVEECLLPDGCDSCNDPLMRRPLKALAAFDRSQLKRVSGADPEWDPLWSLNLFMSKNCAGLNHSYRADPVELREAFRTGEFTSIQKTALSWAFSGMRRKYMFPMLVAGAQLPIFEVVRCFWTVFEGCAFGCGPWLNQWADDPDKPHPSAKGRAFPGLPAPRYSPRL
ncbi:MAG: hypothetical protein OXJ53_09330 [Gammaproteobacteria bacterium]|nr:hypothetical protein [Gammaproteobacteria bacterium]MDD9963818.1 hypothetical protein [Gammaproteobacteria bacterium]MDE0273792.1 hypothetical protein [Gammaproteobacteria bacterium]